MSEENAKARAAPTGKKYLTTRSLMQDEGIPQVVQEKVGQMLNDSRVATQMAQLRHRAGITQKAMADALKITQSAVSKLEAGRDDNITIGQVKEYARITGERISLLFGKPFSHQEAIQLHANGLKSRLDEVVNLANQNVALQSEIKGFLANTFYNLCNVISLCTDRLPVQDDDSIEEIRVEIITGRNVTPTSAPTAIHQTSTKS